MKLRNILLLLGVLVVLYFFSIFSSGQDNLRFSHDEWVNHPEKRLLMVNDLMEDNRLNGKSRTEIIKLLGEPQPTDRFVNLSDMTYYLGTEANDINDSVSWLVFQMDKANKVRSYDVILAD